MPESLQTDVAIVGAGPAGLSAALWCVELGLDCIVLEKGNEAGGQLLWTHNRIENYLGFEAQNGTEVRDNFLRQVLKRPVAIRYSAGVGSITADPFRLSLSDAEAIEAKAIIFAAGVRRNRPDIDGIERFWGKGIIESGKRDKQLAAGKTAVVVGGGDAGFENALILSEFAEKVFLVHRRNSFRARPEFIEAVASEPKIELITNAELIEVAGNDSLEEVSIADVADGTVTKLEAQTLIFRLGVVPNSEPLAGIAELDDRGYIKIDSFCRTSREGIYAVGDVANPISPTISSAAGMGSTAAKAVFSWI